VLDGWLARRWRQDTPVGALVDGVADKLFAVSLLGTLIGTGMISPLFALLLATRELGELPLALRLLMNRRARKVELERKAHAFGKIATALEFATVVAVLLHAPRVGVWVGVTAAFGAAAAVTYWAREIRAGRARRAAAYAR
jgi:CDP-diacylglycerol--glycerol-3-phosphate 3-phosphatidyltransferase/cardiolipin synthase